MCRTGQHILVIEDMPSMALYLKIALELEGYIVDLAECGKTAIEKVSQSTGPTRFDLIVTDLNLPDMEGVDLLSKLGAMEQCPPRIVLSADTGKETRKRVLAAGAAAYLEKPFDIRKVKQVIEKWCVAKHRLKIHKGGDLNPQYRQLKQNYLQYLETLAGQLENKLPFQKLKSLVHQIKGSASLYGLTGLAQQARALDQRLADHGAAASTSVRDALRRALISKGGVSND
ncbi:MAG: response regulator [Alphaproteobacteria bacterium]|nr:response regulator [Alphaproteobacteria bacterium]